MSDPIEFVEVYEDTIKTPKEVEKETKPTKEVIKEAKKISNEVASTVEDAARAKGWVPQEEWQGPHKDWRDASVFLERGEYFNKMQNQRKIIDSLKAQLDTMVSIQKNIRKNERIKVIEELTRNKTTAINEGDYGTVLEIDKEINKVNVTAQEEEAQLAKVQNTNINVITPQEASAKIMEFIADNPWFIKDKVLRQQADKLADDYRKANPDASLTDVLEQVATLSPGKSDQQEDINKVGDDHGDTRPPPGSVGASSTTTRPSSKRGHKKKTLSDLDPMHREIGQRFVRDGAFASIDDYITELERIGEI